MSKIEEINGKTYTIDEEESEYFFYQEVKEDIFLPFGSEESMKYWEPLDDTPVLCGKCRGDKFKVSACNRDYQTWCYCDCGHKFLVHSG